MNLDEHLERLVSNTKLLSVSMNNFEAISKIKQETIETQKYLSNANLGENNQVVSKLIEDLLSGIEENLYVLAKERGLNLVKNNIFYLLNAIEKLCKMTEDKEVKKAFLKGVHLVYEYEKESLIKEMNDYVKGHDLFDDHEKKVEIVFNKIENDELNVEFLTAFENIVNPKHH